MNRFFTTGCLFAALGVAAGAFGAHGLKDVLTPDMLGVFETAVRYHMYHAFGLIVVGILARVVGATSRATIAGWFFIVGTVLFSGSLYALTLTGIRWFGAITPIGGVAFIIGWVMLGIASFQKTRTT